MHRELELLLGERGGLCRRSEVRPASRIDQAVRAGRLVRVLPGVYALPELADSLSGRAQALGRSDPHAVIVGRAAAALSWWPELAAPRVSAVRAAGAHQQPGFRWVQRQLPAAHVRMLGGVRTLTTAASVLELIPLLGGQVIDEALRRRAASLPELWRALAQAPERPGNRRRRELLHDSRDHPWSEAERAYHGVLRGLGLGGWRANRRIRLSDGTVAYLDVSFDDLLLAIEVDGFGYHAERVAFTADRRRDCLLAAMGWQVVRLAAAQVGTEFASEVTLRVVRARAAALGLPYPDAAKRMTVTNHLRG